MAIYLSKQVLVVDVGLSLTVETRLRDSADTRSANCLDD